MVMLPLEPSNDPVLKPNSNCERPMLEEMEVPADATDKRILPEEVEVLEDTMSIVPPVLSATLPDETCTAP
jgi:hypothetical protein